MKKIFITLFAAIVGGLAVEWDVEQVTPESEPYNYCPVLALDHQGSAYILYYQWNEQPLLKVASNATGAWKTKRVTHLTEAFGEIFSIDVDSSGHTYVAYMDSAGPGKYDIFLATDTTGMFASYNLTDDEAYDWAPVIRVGNSGHINLIYISQMQLYWNWFSINDSLIQPTTSNLNQEGYLGNDIAFFEGETSINDRYCALYIGDDGFLWLTQYNIVNLGPNQSTEYWNESKVSNETSFWPSVEFDGSGYLHVAFTGGFYPSTIRYGTNPAPNMVYEAASTTGPEEAMNERPSLSLGPSGDPHIAWMRSLQVNDTVWQYDIYYTHKTQSGWEEEAVTSTPGLDERPGYGHYFAIDSKGYGHIVWSAPDTTDWIDHIFHAKSKQPIASGIVENPPQSPPLNLLLSLETYGYAIGFELPRSSLVTLMLYDASGRLVEKLASGLYPAGRHTIELGTREHSGGVYFVRGEIGEHKVGAKLIVYKN